jgi:integrase
MPEDRAVRRRYSSGHANVTQARRARDVTRGAKAEGRKAPAPSTMTFGDLFETWNEKLEQLVVDGAMSPTTARNYRELHRLYCSSLDGVRLQDLDVHELEKLYSRLRMSGGRGGRPLAPKSVRNVHGTISRVLNEAVRLGIIPSNPAVLVDGKLIGSEAKQARQRRMREEVWSPAELRAFLDATREQRLYALWHLAATTGMRRSELLGLRWESVDLDGATLRVESVRVVIDHEVIEKNITKSDASAAVVALDPQTVDVLRAHRARQREELMAASEWVDSGLVFVDEHGEGVHPDVALRTFKRLAKRAGLRPIRLHALRHSYAAALRDAGVDVQAISERLRHASARITSDLYLHGSEQIDRQTADLGAAAILGA